MAAHDVRSRRVWVAGHRGLIGREVSRALRARGAEVLMVDRRDLDLRDASATARWIADAAPDGIVIAAGRVGGLSEHLDRPAAMLADNWAIRASILTAAAGLRVARVVMVASSAAYPAHAPQPLLPQHLFTGPPDEAHRAYAMGMLAAMEYARALRRQEGLNCVCVLPAAIYGPGRVTNTIRAQVVHALISRFVAARESGVPEVVVWGTGAARRDFLHAADCGEACVVAYERYDEELPLNIGSGQGVSIAQLASWIKEATAYRGAIRFDPACPEGAAVRVLDAAALFALGWRPRYMLREGLAETARWLEGQGATIEPAQ